MPDKSLFALRVKELRTKRALSQEELAEALSVTSVYISDIEQGKCAVPLEKCRDIADYFDVPLDYLTGMGIFAQWEKIVENKDTVIDQMVCEIPTLKEFDLHSVEERTLMKIFPAFLSDIHIAETPEGIQMEIVFFPFWDK